MATLPTHEPTDKTTPRTDSNYSRLAEAVYEQNSKLKLEALKNQSEWGRWLVASCLALSAAGLWASVDRDSGSEWAFIAGIILAFFSGFFALINWELAFEQYHKWSSHKMLEDHKYWPTEIVSGLACTRYLAFTFGILSFIALIAGGVLLAK
jgi:hypothetical protein